MLLKNLYIINFKVFENLNLQFKPEFNLILGDNGVGKNIGTRSGNRCDIWFSNRDGRYSYTQYLKHCVPDNWY